MTTTTTTSKSFGNFSSSSDDDFCEWIRLRLSQNPLSKKYPKLFSIAPDVFLRWRKRFAIASPKVWKRLFDLEKITKEFVEAAPVLDAVVTMIEKNDSDDIDSKENKLHQDQKQTKQYTIIDLCSGKGYMGMFLSEILPPNKVFRIVLMDKAWPMRNSKEAKPQHINWDHIYGTYTTTNENGNSDGIDNEINNNSNNNKSGDADKDCTAPTKSFYDSWPIPIDCSKQDLKASRQLKNIREHYLSNKDHPVILLGKSAQ